MSKQTDAQRAVVAAPRSVLRRIQKEQKASGNYSVNDGLETAAEYVRGAIAKVLSDLEKGSGG